jgi:hypothetical protein
MEQKKREVLKIAVDMAKGEDTAVLYVCRQYLNTGRAVYRVTNTFYGKEAVDLYNKLISEGQNDEEGRSY